MTRHPIAASFFTALAIALVLAGLVLAVYPPQQVPWMLFLVPLAFPFIWFFCWIVINAIAWWKATTKGEA
jgi:hypothetical protein